MGSLITALQNQNIAAANQETLGDIYAANPTNLGYTDNPFGYTAAPAVVQTAYPKYGYNATAPMMPPSYEDYDLTTLFSMLQGMQAPQQDGQPQSFTAPVPWRAKYNSKRANQRLFREPTQYRVLPRLLRTQRQKIKLRLKLRRTHVLGR